MYSVCFQCLPNRGEGSFSSNWTESKAVASLPLFLPPCTLQGRAATREEAAVHYCGNWPWFIGGQSSQRELAQHWQEARQGHTVNISKPTPTQPKPPTARTPLPEISCHRAGECEFMCVCVWVQEVTGTHTGMEEKICHKKWQAVSLNWRKKPLSSSSVNSCWQSLCKDS